MKQYQKNNVVGTLLACLVVAVIAVTSAQEDVTYETVEHAGFTFSVSGSALPWAQASEACESRGQKLASVENPEKDDVLVELFSEHKHTNTTLKGNSWISATEEREGVWLWKSLEKPLYYSRWFKDGQPDDKENLNCVYLASTAMLYWRDANCSASMYFICEGAISDDTTTTDATTTPEEGTTTDVSATTPEDETNTEGSAISSQSFSPFVMLLSTVLVTILALSHYY